jgi:transcriptional regulator with XRE-family HTH domain
MLRGERLRELRLRRGFTQDELANLCDITGKQVRVYEAGDGNPSAKSLVKMAETLRISTDYLLGLVHSEHEYFAGDELKAEETQLLTYIRQGDANSIAQALRLMAQMIQYHPKAGDNK